MAAEPIERASSCQAPQRNIAPAHLHGLGSGLLKWMRHSPEDLSAGFVDAAATWLHDSEGRPAAVAVQPGFLDFAYAAHIGVVAHTAFVRGLDIIKLPAELGWLDNPHTALLLWVPVGSWTLGDRWA
jgi:hypothetical protein